jgi:hypothetical protein
MMNGQVNIHECPTESPGWSRGNVTGVGGLGTRVDLLTSSLKCRRRTGLWSTDCSHAAASSPQSTPSTLSPQTLGWKNKNLRKKI